MSGHVCDESCAHTVALPVVARPRLERAGDPPAVAAGGRTGSGAYPDDPEPVIDALSGPAGDFDRLLADPHEQFDRGGELLASIQRYAGAAPMAAGGKVVNGPPGEVVYGDPPARVQAAALRAYADRHHPGASETWADRGVYGMACSGCGSWTGRTRR